MEPLATLCECHVLPRGTRARKLMPWAGREGGPREEPEFRGPSRGLGSCLSQPVGGAQRHPGWGSATQPTGGLSGRGPGVKVS